MSVLNKLTSTLKEDGLKGIAAIVFKKLIYRRQTIVILRQDLSQKRKKFKSSKRWEIREFTIDDLPFCHQHFKRYTCDYKDLFNEGLTAHAAFEAGTNKMIAVAWYAPRDFYDQHYHRYTFNVAPHQVFQFAGEVAPDYRNTQISVNVMHAAWQHWREQGKQEITTSVDVLNTPSLRICFHLYWEETGQLIHFHRLFFIARQTVEHYEGERFEQHQKKHRRKKANAE